MRWLMAATLVLAAATPVAAQKVNDAAGMMKSLGGGGLTGKKLAEAIRKASAYPLGSERNPVRADMPEGQRAYLNRLRCGDGTAPAFVRVGSTGIGPYGYILDAYTVSCPGVAPVTVYMDMYHDHAEVAPAAGFAMDVPSV